MPDRRWLQQRWGEPRQSAAAAAEKQRACGGLFQHLPCVSTFFKHTILLNFSFIVSILLSEGSESHRLSNSSESSLSHKLQDPTMMTHGWGHFRGTSEPKKASNIEVCCNWHVLLALGCRLRLRGARCSGCPRCSAADGLSAPAIGDCCYCTFPFVCSSLMEQSHHSPHLPTEAILKQGGFQIRRPSARQTESGGSSLQLRAGWHSAV